MTYNMYNTQLAMSWVQRVNKEEKTAQHQIEKQVLKDLEEQKAVLQASRERSGGSVASFASSSKAPSGFTSKTSFLKTRLERLESELAEERESRKQVEADLQVLRAASQPGTPQHASRPGTPQHAAAQPGSPQHAAAQPGKPHACACHSPRKQSGHACACHSHRR